MSCVAICVMHAAHDFGMQPRFGSRLDQQTYCQYTLLLTHASQDGGSIT